MLQDIYQGLATNIANIEAVGKIQDGFAPLSQRYLIRLNNPKDFLFQAGQHFPFPSPSTIVIIILQYGAGQVEKLRGAGQQPHE